MIETIRLEFSTKGENDILNLTDDIQSELEDSEVREGTVVLLLQSTTSSLLILEWENGILEDLRKVFENIAPKSRQYEHEKAWHDGNGHSHVKAAIRGCSLTVPFTEKKLSLGTWQQIALVEFDIKPRKRTVIMQILA